MSFLLIIVIAALLFALFRRRKPWTPPGRQDYYPPQEPPFGTGYGNRFDRNGYGPGFGPGYGPGFGPQGGGFGVPSFMGGMAAGALLSYLFEQGRIGMDQYNMFSMMDQEQMMHELMDQNIIQQHEIDDLQRQMGDYSNDGNGYNGFDYNGFDYDASGDFNDGGNGDNWV